MRETPELPAGSTGRCRAKPQPASVSRGRRGGPAGGRGSAVPETQEVCGRRNSALPGLIRAFALRANQRRGAAPPGPAPSAPARSRARVPVQSLRVLSPARPAMSSTQFNKGPSYGLSAEVKNRVSPGSDPRSSPRGRRLPGGAGVPRPSPTSGELGGCPALREIWARLAQSPRKPRGLGDPSCSFLFTSAFGVLLFGRGRGGAGGFWRGRRGPPAEFPAAHTWAGGPRGPDPSLLPIARS